MQYEQALQLQKKHQNQQSLHLLENHQLSQRNMMKQKHLQEQQHLQERQILELDFGNFNLAIQQEMQNLQQQQRKESDQLLQQQRKESNQLLQQQSDGQLLSQSPLHKTQNKNCKDACDNCCKTHAKCEKTEGDSNSCKRCSSEGKECVFDKVKKTRGRKPGSKKIKPKKSNDTNNIKDSNVANNTSNIQNGVLNCHAFSNGTPSDVYSAAENNLHIQEIEDDTFEQLFNGSMFTRTQGWY